ncbi:hypothetical protein N5D61_17095 [Pseudomonas sp. GD03842]|uniref:hypothetical protein n=1 Tax=Pseudomonas sp. GD03842 TaxID=2975385 RepID=UPI002446B903|nr:hypothetical protein [Pseudomonas sp. GD03842]MDH0748047.1 hypothetical protein [Pseudomonas sp. GD03842]
MNSTKTAKHSSLKQPAQILPVAKSRASYQQHWAMGVAIKSFVNVAPVQTQVALVRFVGKAAA